VYLWYTASRNDSNPTVSAAQTSCAILRGRKIKAEQRWILTADRKFNIPLLFPSGLDETTIAGTVREESVGSVYSSPLVANGIVYFGSADGFLYALEEQGADRDLRGRMRNNLEAGKQGKSSTAFNS
jgi:hypothetical protein